MLDPADDEEPEHGDQHGRLAQPVVDALEAKDGVVFLEPPGIPTDLGPVVVFTLPDKVGWSAYVVVDLPGNENLAEALRLNTVFSVDDLELFLRRARFGSPQGGGRSSTTSSSVTQWPASRAKPRTSRSSSTAV